MAEPAFKTRQPRFRSQVLNHWLWGFSLPSHSLYLFRLPAVLTQPHCWDLGETRSPYPALEVAATLWDIPHTTSSCWVLKVLLYKNDNRPLGFLTRSLAPSWAHGPPDYCWAPGWDKATYSWHSCDISVKPEWLRAPGPERHTNLSSPLAHS